VLTDSIRFSADPAHPRPRLHRESFVSYLIKPFLRRMPHMDEVPGHTHLMEVAWRRMADMMSRMFGKDWLKSLSAPVPDRLKRKAKLANSAGADVMAASRQDTGVGSTSSVRSSQRR